MNFDQLVRLFIRATELMAIVLKYFQADILQTILIVDRSQDLEINEVLKFFFGFLQILGVSGYLVEELVENLLHQLYFEDTFDKVARSFLFRR